MEIVQYISKGSDKYEQSGMFPKRIQQCEVLEIFQKTFRKQVDNNDINKYNIYFNKNITNLQQLPYSGIPEDEEVGWYKLYYNKAGTLFPILKSRNTGKKYNWSNICSLTVGILKDDFEFDIDFEYVSYSSLYKANKTKNIDTYDDEVEIDNKQEQQQKKEQNTNPNKNTTYRDAIKIVKREDILKSKLFANIMGWEKNSINNTSNSENNLNNEINNEEKSINSEINNSSNTAITNTLSMELNSNTKDSKISSTDDKFFETTTQDLLLLQKSINKSLTSSSVVPTEIPIRFKNCTETLIIKKFSIDNTINDLIQFLYTILPSDIHDIYLVLPPHNLLNPLNTLKEAGILQPSTLIVRSNST